MWKDASAECRKEGADLASIHNIEEQSFIISQSGYSKFTYLHKNGATVNALIIVILNLNNKRLG